MFRKIRRLFYEHLIRPFTETFAPLSEVVRGACVGVFVGLLPIMGIQMYVAATIWLIFRYVLRVRFNLSIAVALVWITNPITVVPIYYTYLVAGNWALRSVDSSLQPLAYAEFEAIFTGMMTGPELSWDERIVQGTVMLFWEFGWPIVVGSLVFAVPLTVLSFPMTGLALKSYRRRLAARQGLTYEEWKRRYVHSSHDPPRGPESPHPPRKLTRSGSPSPVAAEIGKTRSPSASNFARSGASWSSPTKSVLLSATARGLVIRLAA